ncbi:MAG: hypothetical protein IJM10_08385 [Clostridia bacterium]|nr:hypothetical protein [Clostridia bacterium]
MKSDVIHVTNEGEGVAEAIKQAEAVAAFRSLSKKDSIHLNLLTEEMMGMMQALTDKREADFWIESENRSFMLHLRTETAMNAEMREKLLSASTSGTNAAAKGVMGKIRDIFNRIIEPADANIPSGFSAGWSFSESGQVVNVWSLNTFKINATDSDKEEWDELEKSIIANIADEIKIGISGNTVEMIVYKTID